MGYIDICNAAQRGVLDAIPQEWRVDINIFKSNKDLRSVPAASGILTPRELEITELDVSTLAPKIASLEYTALEVTVAFCKRAAIAHQMVNCLTDFFPDEAFQQAKELDEALLQTKRPVGPLHGIPLAVKVSSFTYVFIMQNAKLQQDMYVKV